MPARHGCEPSRSATLTELDRLAGDYFRSVSFGTSEQAQHLELELSQATELNGDSAYRLSVVARSGVRNGVAYRSGGLVSTRYVKTSGGWKMHELAWNAECPIPIGPMCNKGVG